MTFVYKDRATRDGYTTPVLLLLALTVCGSLFSSIAVLISFGKQFRR